MRFYLVFLFELGVVWYTAMFFSGVVSVLWGTFAALNQFNIKRLYAYSAIVNVGYLLLDLSYGTLEAFSSAMNYIVVYLFSTFAIFLTILLFRRVGGLKKIPFIMNYNLFYTHGSAAAVLVALIFFSLAGIPPLAGFFIKFFLFRSLFLVDFLSNFAIFVILATSVISAFYYIRVVRLIFFTSIRVPATFVQMDFLLTFLFVFQIFFIVLFLFLQPVALLVCTNLVSSLFL